MQLFATYTQNLHTNNTILFQFGSLSCAKTCTFKQGCINGTIHLPIKKNGSVIYSFFGKRGLIVYLAALKKGAIRATHPYHVIYRELPPPPRVCHLPSLIGAFAVHSMSSSMSSGPQFSLYLEAVSSLYEQ